MFDIEMDLSGLERLQKVAQMLDGKYEYTCNCAGNLDLAENEQEALMKEFIGHLMDDEISQKDFIRSQSFSYHSNKLGKRITVKQLS